MTVLEIMNLAIIDAGIAIPEAYGKRWLNEGLNELAIMFDSACLKGTSQIVCVDVNEYYNLPSGCLRIKEITDEDKDNYKDYIADESSIKFDSEGTYNLLYYKQPNDVTTTAETPGCHTLYHKALSNYVTHKALADKKPDKSNLYYSMFLTKSNSVDSRVKRMKGKNYTPAPPFR